MRLHCMAINWKIMVNHTTSDWSVDLYSDRYYSSYLYMAKEVSAMKAASSLFLLTISVICMLHGVNGNNLFTALITVKPS